MFQLKRPGRAHGKGSRSFVAFGVAVEIELSDASLWPSIEWLLPPGATEGAAGGVHSLTFSLVPGAGEYWTLRIGGEPWIEHVSWEVASTALDQQIRLHVAAHAVGRVFVHAGVIAVAGHALVIPGESFSGKTTLVAALVGAGATYYSDEYAVLDADGRVHPYARPLSIRTADGTRMRQRPVPGGPDVSTPATGGARLSLVALTQYRAGAEWLPEPRTPANGIVSLMANTVPARERPQETLRVLNAATSGARVLESDRGEASVVAPRLLEALSGA